MSVVTRRSIRCDRCKTEIEGAPHEIAAAGWVTKWRNGRTDLCPGCNGTNQGNLVERKRET